MEITISDTQPEVEPEIKPIVEAVEELAATVDDAVEEVEELTEIEESEGAEWLAELTPMLQAMQEILTSISDRLTLLESNQNQTMEMVAATLEASSLVRTALQEPTQETMPETVPARDVEDQREVPINPETENLPVEKPRHKRRLI